MRELQEAVKGIRETAAAFVQRHAAIYARDVPIETVNAICGALGDISIDEATAVLDRLQSEYAPVRSSLEKET